MSKVKIQAIDFYTHCAVQFSVQREGLLAWFGPVKVSPQCLPLHVLICLQNQGNSDEWKKRYKRKVCVENGRYTT